VDPASPSAAAVYTEFAVWRMFVGSDDDGAHYADGGAWPESAIPPAEAEIPLADVDGFSASPAFAPYDLGTTYYTVDLGEGTDQTLHVDLSGEPGAQWGLAWAVWRDGEPASTGTALVGDGEPLAADIPLAGGTRVKLGVVNGGPVDLAADLHVPRRSFVLDLSLDGATTTTTTGGETDSDPTVTTPPDDQEPLAAPEERGGCGCADGPSGSANGAMLLALAGLGRWSRRSRRR
jgi:hypothetical protein